jgi:hypothetical protein
MPATLRGRQVTSCLRRYIFRYTHPDLLQLGFHRPCGSPVGVSEIAIVGVGDNHTSARTDFTVHPECTANF